MLAVVCRHCTAPEGGCTPSPPSSLIPGADKTGVIPDIRANARGTVVDCANTIKPILSVVSVLQSQVGGRRISPWTVFSATQIQQHGLWCQVNSVHGEIRRPPTCDCSTETTESIGLIVFAQSTTVPLALARISGITPVLSAPGIKLLGGDGVHPPSGAVQCLHTTASTTITADSRDDMAHN